MGSFARLVGNGTIRGGDVDIVAGTGVATVAGGGGVVVVGTKVADKVTKTAWLSLPELWGMLRPLRAWVQRTRGKHRVCDTRRNWVSPPGALLSSGGMIRRNPAITPQG
jgi:hypothetical protein